VTRLRQIMLEELERRNYSPGTIRCYIRVVEQFAQHFYRPPDQLGLEHIRQYQAGLLRQKKLAPNSSAHFSTLFRKHFGMTPRDYRSINIPSAPSGQNALPISPLRN
jgi:integrase/recombinase XerD